MADRMLALYAICHLLVLPVSPFTRLDDTITNTAKERSRSEKLKSMPQELKSMPLELKSTLGRHTQLSGQSRDTYKWNLAAYQIQLYKIRVKYTLELTIIIKYPQVVKICAKNLLNIGLKKCSSNTDPLQMQDYAPKTTQSLRAHDRLYAGLPPPNQSMLDLYPDNRILLGLEDRIIYDHDMDPDKMFEEETSSLNICLCKANSQGPPAQGRK
ncbi:hypothetical protein BT96DRAFT_944727 [Gymnopus androsaceus JB14]|uniref:Uncharacterized protein n=1 Tax=Gymnopus androsaceus JB14 TaxID=1447944 RepID=A0A6A4H583_9AGAR|nr:hypothetical protein BT96DRAFT_944727 [Gymnopus androsaceus JB14]